MVIALFDQVKFYEVSETELLQMREDFKAGRLQLRIEEGVLNLKEYNEFLKHITTAFKPLKIHSKLTLRLSAAVGTKRACKNISLKALMRLMKAKPWLFLKGLCSRIAHAGFNLEN